MGLLDTSSGNPLDKIAGLISDPFGNRRAPRPNGPDFPHGLEITEYVDGAPDNDTKITLVGNAMPKQPFGFGGEQKIVKAYYPGYREPSVHILGPREKDVTIVGLLKAKKFQSEDFAGVPIAYQEAIDEMRKRGNLVRIVLGEWTRYGFIEEAQFKLYQLTRIEYEVKFVIIGDRPPTNCKFIQNSKQIPDDVNQELITSAAAFEAARDHINAPSKSITDIINGAVSSVANVVNGVTGFVTSLLALANNITSGLNRALGLIKNARATISAFKRQLGALKLSIASVTAGYKAAKKITFASMYAHSVLTVVSLAQSMELLLARMQRQFELIRKSTPNSRFLVRANDTLQNIAQKFYNNADLWKQIYDHNKLSTTALTAGMVLEIPHI